MVGAGAEGGAVGHSAGHSEREAHLREEPGWAGSARCVQVLHDSTASPWGPGCGLQVESGISCTQTSNQREKGGRGGGGGRREEAIRSVPKGQEEQLKQDQPRASWRGPRGRGKQGGWPMTKRGGCCGLGLRGWEDAEGQAGAGWEVAATQKPMRWPVTSPASVSRRLLLPPNRLAPPGLHPPLVGGTGPQLLAGQAALTSTSAPVPAVPSGRVGGQGQGAR